jgi:hypothetical protein
VSPALSDSTQHKSYSIPSEQFGSFVISSPSAVHLVLKLKPAEAEGIVECERWISEISLKKPYPYPIFGPVIGTGAE